MTQQNKLSPNSLALIALCNEYCATLENAGESDAATFVNTVLKLLPRIYISASDFTSDGLEEGFGHEASLDENHYDEVRNQIAMLLGADDSYLEVFEEDMKYSDTPIAASVSEGLADLFQEFYNFIEAVKDAPTYIVDSALNSLKDDFENYWSTTLCNVMRPLNHIKYTSTENQYDDYQN